MCGTLPVLLDRRHPEGKKIDIYFELYLHANPGPAESASKNCVVGDSTSTRELGYGAIWFSEGLGREAFTQAALLLAGTSRILVATGIANIYGRDPFTMAAGQKTLSEAYQSRFLLGLGVSHVPLVEQLRGHSYE